VGKAVVGQDAAVTGLVIALLAKGHALLEGVPGVAKTLLVRSLSHALSLDTKRVQFTPDLMPGDVTGSLVYDAKTGEFEFREGPVFTNILLADEINRTPPKTQSALLEAMEERQVTIDGERYPLSPLFSVLATENPIEYEGTYPLPEAQLDRFLLKILLPYPAADDELQIVARWDAGFNARRLDRVDIQPLSEVDAIPRCRAEIQNMRVEPGVQRYIVDIVRRTRDHAAVHYGASPRAAVALLLCSKALAAIRGRNFSTPDDVRDIARPVLRHRLTLRAEAELDGATPDSVITDILQSAEVPR